MGAFGGLAQVLAAGMRGKREGELRQRELDDRFTGAAERTADRTRDEQDRQRAIARQGVQDSRDSVRYARETRMGPLEEEMTRQEVARGKARADQTGEFAPKPPADRREINPITGHPWANAQEKYTYERGLSGARRAPERGPVSPAPKPRPVNAIQDLANDYLARFAGDTDAPSQARGAPAGSKMAPVQARAKKAYEAFLQSGGAAQTGENPDQIWTAFLAASERMAGTTRPPSATDALREGLLGRLNAESPDGSAVAAPLAPTPATTPAPARTPQTPEEKALARATRYEVLMKQPGMTVRAATRQVLQELPD